MKTAALRLVYTGRNYIPTAEGAKDGCSVANVPGMSVVGLCAKFASTIKCHRTSLRGANFGRHALVNTKWVYF